MNNRVLEKLGSIYGAMSDDYIPAAPQIPYNDLKKYYREYLQTKSSEEKTPIAGVILPSAILAGAGGLLGGVKAGPQGAIIGASILGGLGALLYGVSKAVDDREIEKAKQLVDMSDTSYEFKKALNKEIDNRYLLEKSKDRAAARSSSIYIIERERNNNR